MDLPTKLQSHKKVKDLEKPAKINGKHSSMPRTRSRQTRIGSLPKSRPSSSSGRARRRCSPSAGALLEIPGNYLNRLPVTYRHGYNASVC
jgi:hypothetical protein